MTTIATDSNISGQSTLSVDRFCSVARTVEILSDAWMFLVLRESFFGARRFEHFGLRQNSPYSTPLRSLLLDFGGRIAPLTEALQSGR